MIYKELRKQKIEQLEIAAVLLVFRERERERERWIVCFLTWLLHFPNPWCGVHLEYGGVYPSFWKHRGQELSSFFLLGTISQLVCPCAIVFFL
jgi:hypothetical protein